MGAAFVAASTPSDDAAAADAVAPAVLIETPASPNRWLADDCSDHNDLIATVAAPFQITSCAQVVPFCANPMPLPPALIPTAEDPRLDQLTESLRADLLALLASAETGAAIQLNSVLALACPNTCNTGCAAPTSSGNRMLASSIAPPDATAFVAASKPSDDAAAAD